MQNNKNHMQHNVVTLYCFAFSNFNQTVVLPKFELSQGAGYQEEIYVE